MSDEPAEVVALRSALASINPATPNALAVFDALNASCDDVMAVGDAARRAAQANSMDGVMAGAVATILAAEAAGNALNAVASMVAAHQAECAEAARKAKADLLHFMVDAGAPGFPTEHHHIDWQASDRVEITDAALLPLAYWREPPAPEPQPDKRNIAAALKKGTPVPGARLVQGHSLRITTKRENQK